MSILQNRKNGTRRVELWEWLTLGKGRLPHADAGRLAVVGVGLTVLVD